MEEQKNKDKIQLHNDWEEVMRVDEYAFTYDELQINVML